MTRQPQPHQPPPRRTALTVRWVWPVVIAAAACSPAWAGVIMLDDFDGEPNSLNNMFGSRTLLNTAGYNDLYVTTQSFSDNALRLLYDHTVSDAGWSTRLGGQSTSRSRDLSDAIALHFYVRGVVSTTRFQVRLTDALGASATENVTGITSTWSQRTIDLTTGFSGVDLSRLTELAVLVSQAYSDDGDGLGSLYFDDIYFETDSPEPADDEALLLEMARRCFRYFWDLADPTTGFSPDRATYELVTSIAGVGYQLGALPIGVKYGWVTRQQAATRARKILDTLATRPQRPDGYVPDENAYIGYKGFYYHMVDSTTGLRVWDCELSSIDSTLCFLGIINVLQFFDGASADEVAIRYYADTILDRTDWTFMYDAGANMIWMEWRPETGLGGLWGTYTDETITMTLLAAASRTHAVPIDVYYGWSREQRHYDSYAAYASLTGTQFTYYQGQGWLDLKGRTERNTNTPVNWFRNNWAATRAGRQFAMDKSGEFSTYGPNAWGISDSTVPGAAYYAPRAQPRLSGEADNDNGTIPCAAAGSTLPFFYEDPDGNLALAALRHYYEDFDDAAAVPKLWKIYGLVDAYNESGESFWYSNEFICLGQGALLLAIENYLADNAVGKLTGSFQPLAHTMDEVLWPAWDPNNIIYAREAEQWDAHSAGAGMENEYHQEASSYWTFQLGTEAGNNVQYDVKNYWPADRVCFLELTYSEDVAGNVLAVEWDYEEVGRFTTEYSGGWLSFITSPPLRIGRVGPGQHHLRIVNTNGGTWGVNLDVIRVYAYLPGDIDTDGDVDLADFACFEQCLAGPETGMPPECSPADFEGADLDGNDDVDLADFAVFQQAFGQS